MKNTNDAAGKAVLLDVDGETLTVGLGLIGAALLGNEAAQGLFSDLYDAIVEMCKDDDDGCPQLIAKINRGKNGIARRFRQLSENTGGIDQTTHWEQLRGRQRGLRKLLNQAAAKGCKIPSDAWHWASK